MVEAKKRERAEALNKVKELCKEFGFTAGMLKNALAEGGGNDFWHRPNRRWWTRSQHY